MRSEGEAFQTEPVERVRPKGSMWIMLPGRRSHRAAGGAEQLQEGLHGCRRLQENVIEEVPRACLESLSHFIRAVCREGIQQLYLK